MYEIPFTEANTVTSVMLREATPMAKEKHGIKAGVYNPTWEEVMEYSASLQAYLNKYPQVKAHVDGLVGQVRSCSRHAGGVVVAEDLDTHMPLINSGGVRQTPSNGQLRHSTQFSTIPSSCSSARPCGPGRCTRIARTRG